MRALDFIFRILAAGIWFLIGILYLLCTPVAILIVIIAFPFWWVGKLIRLRLIKS